MSLEIKYLGKLGNNLFQYCVSRLYAEKHELIIETDLPKRIHFIEFIEYKQPILKPLIKNKQIMIRDMHFNLQTCSFPYYGNRRYKFRGYYQNSLFLNNNSDRIMEYFKPYFSKKKIIKNKKDILVLIRLGDDFNHFGDSEIIHPSYYTNILDKEVFNKCFIYLYPIKYQYTNVYLSYFKKYNPILIEQKDIDTNFSIPFYYDKIICSNSTFHWWGCFLSNSSTIYTPDKFGLFGIDELKKHNDYNIDMWNIKNKSIKSESKFVDITKLLVNVH